MSQELSFHFESGVDFEKAAQVFKARRRAIVDAAGEQLLRRTQLQIRASSLNDSHGKVQSWQQKYVGSGGGYAAVRATASGSGPNSPGAITNYLESGHAIRNAGYWAGKKPSASARRKANKSVSARTRAFGFYAATKPEETRIAASLKRQAEQLIVEAMNAATV